jgi:hypothetical protein
MGKMFHQHPDGLIFIRDGQTVLYSDTNENFESDFGIAVPELPPGADEQIYEPDKRHVFQDRENVISGGDRVWPQGDDIIRNVGRGINAQQARQPAPPPQLEDVPEKQRASVVADWIKANAEWKKADDARLAKVRSRKKS